MKIIICRLTIVILACIVGVYSNAVRGRPISNENKPSVLINGNGWKNAKVDRFADTKQNLSDEQVRKYLAMLKNQNRKNSFEKEDIVVSQALEVLDPIQVSGNYLTKQLTTPEPQTTVQTSTEELTTQPDETTQEATTENPNNSPKTGDVEMLVEDIVYSGNMIHWSAREQYLAISDIWGQKYLRFKEIPPATTTVAPATTIATTEAATEAATVAASDDVTTEVAAERDMDDTTTTEAPLTTTEILTTTLEPLPYDIKTFEVSKDVVFLIQPQLKTEGTYPLMIPVDDYGQLTEDASDFILAFGDLLHIGHWDLESSYMNMSNVEWHNTARANMDIDQFHVPSPAWVDPAGKMFIGSRDLRKFEKVVTNSKFVTLPNSFEQYSTLDVLSKISCEPNGMAWSPDNSTLYFSDGHTRNITKCMYDMDVADASNCSTILNVKEDIFETAVPQGIATDENNHIWVAVAENDGKGAIIEIDPESNKIISTIDLEDPNLVDVVFAGEDLDFMYVLSKKSLYKMTGLGVSGMHVPDFVWNPDEKKRSIRLDKQL